MLENSCPQSRHLAENEVTIAPHAGHFFTSPNLSDFGAAALAFKNANSLLVVPTNCTITEVVTLSSSNNLKCFPNPSTSSFTIQAKGNFNFVLMNMDGQLLETGSAIQETTVGESLSSGIYFLQISSGNEVEMMKIVKSN